jgi:hypothetical protein
MPNLRRFYSLLVIILFQISCTMTTLTGQLSTTVPETSEDKEMVALPTHSQEEFGNDSVATAQTSNRRISALDKASFPTEEIDYPAGWPTGLELPRSFRLVEAKQGKMVISSYPGWYSKYIYTGNLEAALDETLSFTTSEGWQLTEKVEDGYGGVLLFLHRGHSDTSALALDRDNEDLTKIKIMATFFVTD